jgi:hypothetical protein
MDTVAQNGSMDCREASASLIRAGGATCEAAFRNGLWRTRMCSFAETGVRKNIVRAKPAPGLRGPVRKNT